MGLLTPAQKASLSSGAIQIANLVELEFSFGVERYWTGLHELSYEGKTWLPVGDMGKISDLESSQDLRAHGVKLSISLPFNELGVDSKFRDVKSAEYKGRKARTALCFLDESFRNVNFALERNYFMDSLMYRIDPANGASITLTLESELLSAGKRRVKRWTDAQQRQDFPNDQGFQFLSYLASGVKAKWGTSGAFFQ